MATEGSWCGSSAVQRPQTYTSMLHLGSDWQRPRWPTYSIFDSWMNLNLARIAVRRPILVVPTGLSGDTSSRCLIRGSPINLIRPSTAMPDAKAIEW